MVGDIKAIDNVIGALKEKKLVLKIVQVLQDYLSCEIKFSTDKKRSWLGQLHLTKNWIRNLVNALRIFAVIKLQACLNF